jgi:hypothetical protein
MKALLVFYIFVPGSAAGIVLVDGEYFPEWVMATISATTFLLDNYHFL